MRALRSPGLVAASVLSGCLVHGRASAAEVTADWVGPSAGIWHDPANWSTRPDYPNNGTPPNTSYDVRIAPVVPTTVTLETPVTVDNLTVGPGSTLSFYFGTQLGIVDTLQ